MNNFQPDSPIRTVIIGGQWKGLGNSWANDDINACVDCLNVLPTKDGQWLKSRPSFKDTRLDTTVNMPNGTSTVREIMGMAIAPRTDAGSTLGYLSLKGAGLRQFSLDQTTDIGTLVENASIEVSAEEDYTPPDWLVDYGSETSISAIQDRSALYMFSRCFNGAAPWRYNGFKGQDGTIIYQPFLALQGSRYGKYFDGVSLLDPFPFGLYGMLPIFTNHTYTELTTVGNMDSGKSYWIDLQFITKDPQGHILGYSTPQHVWRGERPGTLNMSASGTGAKITTNVYAVHAGWRELGWACRAYQAWPGVDPLWYTDIGGGRGWFGPTHVRILRTLGDVPDYYWMAEEYEIGYVHPSLWTQVEDNIVKMYGVRGVPKDRSTGEYYTAKDTYESMAATDKSYFTETVEGVDWMYINDSARPGPEVIVEEWDNLTYVTGMADSELTGEFQDYRGCPSLMWLGEIHNNRLFVASSDLRNAWRGYSEIFFSLPGNYFAFDPNHNFIFGNGEPITGMVSLPGTNALFIVTTSQIFAMMGASTDTYEITKLGDQCGCVTYHGIGLHGSSVAWFDYADIWRLEGGTPTRVTTALVRESLLNQTGSTHEGYGLTWNGQLWYRRDTHAKIGDATKRCFVYDFDTNSTWLCDRMVEGVYEAATDLAYYDEDAEVPTNSWKKTMAGGTKRLFTVLPDADGEYTRLAQCKVKDYLKGDLPCYDETWDGTVFRRTNLERYWIGSWQDFGDLRDKKVIAVRLVASADTQVELVIEGSNEITEDTDIVSRRCTMIVSGRGDRNIVNPSISGKFLRFRLKGYLDRPFNVRHIEVTYEPF